MDHLMSQLGFLLKGGFMMYPLLISGFIALAVVIDRYWFLISKMKTPPQIVSEITALIKKGEVASAFQIIKDIDNPVVSVIAAGLKEEWAPLDEMELAMQNQAEAWIPHLERRIEVLDTIITAAPLMGLLGTITGMMSSFQVLSEKGINEPNAITGGVAEALIATATGLVIALLTLVAYNSLNQIIKNKISEIEIASAQMIEAYKFALRKKS